MKNYKYQNKLFSKRELKDLLAWSFRKYNCVQASILADELKFLGFNYASKSGISISIEDLKVPFVKKKLVNETNTNLTNTRKVFLQGKITDEERLQKTIDLWTKTSEILKDELINFFKNYDPLNCVYIMAFSGARGNISQVRQLIGMRGLMANPRGEIIKLPIQKNFREGLTITDYLISGYGARKGIVDTALRTANSGYLTRRLIDVAQDILIRDKDCLTSEILFISVLEQNKSDKKYNYDKILGLVLQESVVDPINNNIICEKGNPITPALIQLFKQREITKFCIRSPLTCIMYRAICQRCYGWDLVTENLIDTGEAIGIIAGQSIGEPGTQLTMRTFHTGGSGNLTFVKKSARQIICPIDGIVKYKKNLKLFKVRTNIGNTVKITKEFGILYIFPREKNREIIKIIITPNTTLFYNTNDYITKNSVICEMEETIQQVRLDLKTILSSVSGEIDVPVFKNKKLNDINQNRLFWIFYGQTYIAPINSFLNLHSDYKINKHNHIFRAKILNKYPGFIQYRNKINTLFKQNIKIRNNNFYIYNAKFIKSSSLNEVSSKLEGHEYLINLNGSLYLIKSKINSDKDFNEIKDKQIYGNLITNKFLTSTGGTVYYDLNKYNLINLKEKNRILYDKTERKNLKYSTLIWLSEKTYKLRTPKSRRLVKNGDLITKKSEISPRLFCKDQGVVSVTKKDIEAKTISIKTGVFITGNKKKMEDLHNTILYPGEFLFKKLIIKEPSFCQLIKKKKKTYLLIRPLELYEIPSSKSVKQIFGSNSTNEFFNNLENIINYNYESTEKIISTKSINLLSNLLVTNLRSPTNKILLVKYNNISTNNCINLELMEHFNLGNYTNGRVKYKNLETSLLIQPNQFIDKYNILLYLQRTSKKNLAVIQVKSKLVKDKQKEILLISNDDCVRMKKEKFNSLRIKNNYLVNLFLLGRVISINGSMVIIQKGKPYFFPNCKNTYLNKNNKISYKVAIDDKKHISINEKIIKRFPSFYVNYFNLNEEKHINLLFRRYPPPVDKAEKKAESITYPSYEIEKLIANKIFIKKNNKLYSYIFPLVFKTFTINSKTNNPNKIDTILKKSIKPNWNIPFGPEIDSYYDNASKFKASKSHLLLINNVSPSSSLATQSNLTFLKFSDVVLEKERYRIHSITDDYHADSFQNSVYIYHGQFLEVGDPLATVQIETQLTGDIIQGLPKVEQLLEARKNKIQSKRIPLIIKKSLLVENPGLDRDFRFKKVGQPLFALGSINPHRLLQVYFNYYGLLKVFNRSFGRLLNNLNGTFRSFKKTQLVILHAVQTVYKAQGVSIANKHIEVIIKQMTTKVVVSNEGQSTLLPSETVDVYHMKYINKILENSNKCPVYFVPCLTGISNAALNNPSFMSAASFQETTRILINAAINGRLDWLRGLKENVITGRLIPAGTGYINYASDLKQKFDQDLTNNSKQL